MPLSPEYHRKLAFSRIPAKHYKTRTLADLDIGDKFIMLPIPGDGDTAGGYRGIFYIMEKVADDPETHSNLTPPGTRWTVRNVSCDILISMALDEPVVYIQ